MTSLTTSRRTSISIFRKPKWRRWIPGIKKSGTIWIELLIRFDLLGYRSIGAIQQKDKHAHKRYLERSKQEAPGVGGPTQVPPNHESSRKPSLALEIDIFKAAVRRVVRNYVPKNLQDLFGHSPYQADKRLSGIGIRNHSLAILVVLDTTEDYMGHMPMEQAIIRQRNATSTNLLKCMIQSNRHNEDCRGPEDDPLPFKVNLAHIALNIPARWSKILKPTESRHAASMAAASGTNAASSRELICVNCERLIDVKHIQLRVADGFRTVYCTHCRWYGRAKQLLCSCRVPWYPCGIHTTDPPAHRSRKPPRK